MNCLACDEILLGVLDESPDAATQRDLEAHLATCPDCVARMKDHVQVNQLLRRLGALAAAEPVAPLPERLVARILAATRLEAIPTHRSRTG